MVFAIKGILKKDLKYNGAPIKLNNSNFHSTKKVQFIGLENIQEKK